MSGIGLTTLLSIPHVAKLIRDILLILVGIIFLLMLYFGFTEFFIPLLLTAMVLIGIILTHAYEQTNPLILVLLIPITFALGYGLEKLAMVNPMLQQSIYTPPIDIRIIGIAVTLLFILILYVYRCTLFGICKR